MRYLSKIAASLIGLFTVTSTNSAAQDTTSELSEPDAIRAAYESTIETEMLYAPSFLAQVSEAQIAAVTTQLRDELGPIEQISGDDGDYELLTETHRIAVKISLGETGLIEGLLFKPAEPLTATLKETLTKLKGHADQVSYALLINGKIAHSNMPDARLAVGSAFKLGVLKVLVDDIDARKVGWTDVFELMSGDKSLPSGYLQDFPDRAPLTIHSLAAVMIAISDNTATDMLMRILGSDRVAKALGIDVAFTTKQLFAFKHSAEMRTQYVAATAAEKQKILADIQSQPLPKTPNIGHHNQGFEWYVSAERLCELLDEIGPLDIFDIESGPLNVDDWDSVRFKGGSEDGVLNLSAYTIKDGKSYCASVTLNHGSTIDHDAVVGLFNRAMRQLAASN